jgi:hypothetical protein
MSILNFFIAGALTNSSIDIELELPIRYAGSATQQGNASPVGAV